MKKSILFIFLLAGSYLPGLFAQNIGIGTNTPLFKLDIKSSIIQPNNNTHLLNLIGSNPVMVFSDPANAGYGYIKSWTTAFNPGYSAGMEMGAPPGRSLFFSTNYGPTMTIGDNNNVGIGSPPSDYKLAITSGVVQSNTNTHLLSLKGQNPVLSFINSDNSSYGYIKMWNYAPFPPYTNGMVIGAIPGYPIFFSTNNYGVTMTIADNGNVGIGTTNPTYKLSVSGNIRSKEVVVETGWADYVLDEKYPLPSIAEVKQFIKQHNHLPGIPSAKEIEEKGLPLGELQTKMMSKIEELTLYMLQANDRIIQLENILKKLKKRQRIVYK
ncbi:MAG: hypothetical protein ABI688_08625 [Bacteroidota bacterium]